MILSFLRNAIVGSVFAGLILFYFYFDQKKTRLAELKSSEEKIVIQQKETILRDFSAVVSDLNLLLKGNSLRQLLAEPNNDAKKELGKEFESFANIKQVYDQLRFLDSVGNEQVRVNYRNGKAVIVPNELLQNKKERYYFRKTITMSKDELFVSPFDLNMESGMVELPWKPTIRFARPVFDANGEKKGVLILNYLGQELLDRFRSIASGTRGKSWFLNSKGYWIYADVSKKSWGFMFDEKKDTRFYADYPETWKILTNSFDTTHESESGLFISSRIHPLKHVEHQISSMEMNAKKMSDESYHWYVVSHISSDAISAFLNPVRTMTWNLGWISFVLVLSVSLLLDRVTQARVKSEHSLRESESRFRMMAETVPEVFWLSDKSRSRYTYVSDAFCKIWNIDSFELDEVPSLWNNSVHEEHHDEFKKTTSNNQNNDEFSLRYRILDADGNLHWIWDQGYPVKDEDGQTIGFVGIAEDITDIKYAEDRAMQSERLAAVGEAIAGLAHESRNAIQRGLSCMEMLEKRTKDSPEQTELVERGRAAMRELRDLYEHVRHYSAPLVLKQIETDVRRIWRETLDNLDDNIKARHCEIVDRSPESSHGLFCYVDPQAIGQVFRNILENALSDELDKQVNRDYILMEVRWSEKEQSSRNEIVATFTDNGPGLKSEQECRKIFEPFFTTKTKGTGLGMAISKRIVEEHGGALTARCEPGNGLTIEVTIPRGP